MSNLQLILGGARSGKSRLAEQRAVESGLNRIYVATAEAGDSEMSDRISHHQARRQGQWQLVEEPLNLAQVITDYAAAGNCLLVDCLTLWVSNCLHHHVWQAQQGSFFKALEDTKSSKGTVIFVSNEVGMGIVPMGELSREFVDQTGFLHQKLAAICQRVTLTVAGLPLEFKDANLTNID